MAQAPRDQNRIPALIGTSNADGSTPLPVYVDSATNRLLTSATASITTEYTEGNTDATITGVAIMGEAPSDTLQPLSLDASNYLNVNVAAGSITVDSEFPAAAAAADNFANPTTTNVMAMGMWYDGSTWDRALGDSTNGLLVNLGTNNDVTLATLPDTAAGDLAAINSAVSGTLTVDLGANNDVTVTNTTHDNLKANVTVQLEDSDITSANPLPVILTTGSNAVDILGSGSDDSANTFNQLVTGAMLYGYDGSTWDRMRGDSTNGLLVNLGSNNDVTLNTNSGVDIGDVDVTSVVPGYAGTNLGKREDDAHTTLDVGVMALAVRDDDPVAATSGTAGDYEPFHTDGRGVLWTRNVPDTTDLANLSGEHVNKYYTAATPTDGVVWSPAAGKRWYVTDIFIGVSAASTVTLEDDKTGGDAVVWKMELAANSGWSHSFKTPLYSGEDAADLVITSSAGNVYVTVSGYEI